MVFEMLLLIMTTLWLESTSSHSNLSNEDMISLITLSQPEVDTTEAADSIYTEVLINKPIPDGFDESNEEIRYISEDCRTVERTICTTVLPEYAYKMQPKMLNILQHHQIDAIRHCLRRFPQSSFVSHCMGLGKSLSAIATVDSMLSVYPQIRILIVCPVNVVFTWYVEVKK